MRLSYALMLETNHTDDQSCLVDNVRIMISSGLPPLDSASYDSNSAKSKPHDHFRLLNAPKLSMAPSEIQCGTNIPGACTKLAYNDQLLYADLVLEAMRHTYTCSEPHIAVIRNETVTTLYELCQQTITVDATPTCHCLVGRLSSRRSMPNP
jgi:hypothetical protein